MALKDLKDGDVIIFADLTQGVVDTADDSDGDGEVLLSYSKRLITRASYFIDDPTLKSYRYLRDALKDRLVGEDIVGVIRKEDFQGDNSKMELLIDPELAKTLPVANYDEQLFGDLTFMEDDDDDFDFLEDLDDDIDEDDDEEDEDPDPV